VVVIMVVVGAAAAAAGVWVESHLAQPDAYATAVLWGRFVDSDQTHLGDLARARARVLSPPCAT
jgi:hypothetical protein